MENNAIVLFDGECKFCNGSVNFIIERDKNAYFKFAPNQSDLAQDLFKKYKVDKANIDSLVLIENEKVYLYSTAALRIARKLNGLWSMFYGFILVPSLIRNAAYKLFAKYRIYLFGKQDACMMPTAEIRERFLA
jgi:predicted DCC family thiol-disulfide oxidoreductase YuxK